MIAKIATANWPKSTQQYKGFRPLNGDALFVQTDHERWKVQRKRLAPAFQPSVINEQYPCFAKHLTVSERCAELPMTEDDKHPTAIY
jgi:cytochrome P450